MKTPLIATSLLVTSLSLPVNAENLSHLRQLLSTRQCEQCELSSSGLVMGELAGANLRQANLVGANLSRANLQGANLQGANLSGASLYGANLQGANLSGANLTGTDLRESYLTNANLRGVNLDTALMQGAIGIPLAAGTVDDFYRWGYQEWKKNNYSSAIYHYDQAIAIDPQFPGAYLGRAMARYRLGDDGGAIKDAKNAENLFAVKGNIPGMTASRNLLKSIEIASQPTQPSAAGNGNLVDLFTSITSVLLNFF
jgi:tetratricopeptide (TPR) repeat protein